MSEIKLNLLIVGTVVLLVSVFLLPRGGGPLGSVSVSNEYHATTTDSTSVNTYSQIKSTSATLGSIVVASSSATTLTIWNATSTTDIASTTITKLVASIGEGTYTFDVEAPRGLIIATPTAFNGSYVITWR